MLCCQACKRQNTWKQETEIRTQFILKIWGSTPKLNFVSLVVLIYLEIEFPSGHWYVIILPLNIYHTSVYLWWFWRSPSRFQFGFRWSLFASLCTACSQLKQSNNRFSVIRLNQINDRLMWDIWGGGLENIYMHGPTIEELGPAGGLQNMFKVKLIYWNMWWPAQDIYMVVNGHVWKWNVRKSTK